MIDFVEIDISIKNNLNATNSLVLERIKKLSPVSKHHEKLIQELKQKFSQRRAS
jgi:hypothetical protein